MPQLTDLELEPTSTNFSAVLVLSSGLRDVQVSLKQREMDPSPGPQPPPLQYSSHNH